jgi:predicted ATPase
LKCGELEQGLSAVTESLAVTEASGQHLWQAELYRLRGEILLAQSLDAAAEAERCFREAIDFAARQHAKSWELRAVTSLARLLTRQGRGAEVRPRLQKIYEWFTEGFDTADLEDARNALDAI